ncbi:DUF3324 domain-containing protein [Erwinia sp. CPCC 100877]|nr:DUF3324 domain-containing protein [Erwinia sp. CPCC 100877]
MNVLKRSIIWQTLFILVCAIVFLPISEVYGEEVPISVKAILPENQIDKNVGYYDLKVEPNAKQELSFQLNNQGDKDTTVNVEINPAYTGDGGSFIYTDSDSNKDPSMKYPLSSIASSEQTVSIPAKGSTVTKIKLEIPSEPFEGVILGAIRVTSAQSDEKKTDNSGKGFNIVNNFAYSVAIQLRESDNMPKSDLAIKKVFATQVAGRNTVKINLQNPTPTIINDMSYEAAINKKGEDVPLHENKVKGYRVAPNTNYNVPVSWENQPFTAGTYVAKVKAKSEATGQTWDFEQEFVISAKEARALNEKAVDLEKDYLPYILIGAAVLLVLIILLIILLVVLAKKRKKRRRQELARRKKKQKGRTNDKRNKRPAPKRADADRGNVKRKRR